MSKKQDDAVGCSEDVYSPGAFHSFKCTRKGKYLSGDGKYYCKQHLPEEAKKRREASFDKYTATNKADGRRRDIVATKVQLADDLLALYSTEANASLVLRETEMLIRVAQRRLREIEDTTTT